MTYIVALERLVQLAIIGAKIVKTLVFLFEVIEECEVFADNFVNLKNWVSKHV